MNRAGVGYACHCETWIGGCGISIEYSVDQVGKVSGLEHPNNKTKQFGWARAC